jgi:hypothetical protein
MISKFLKAKHWQIFILTFGIPFVIQIAVLISLVPRLPRIVAQNNPDLSFFFRYLILMVIVSSVSKAIYWLWLWSVGVGLQNKIPADITMKIRKFKTAFVIFVACFLIFLTVFFVLAQTVTSQNIENNLLKIAGIMVILIPMQLLSVGCMFYVIYFVARTIKTVELKRVVPFSDFFPEFILIIFYPIGIWIIQPVINKIAE